MAYPYGQYGGGQGAPEGLMSGGGSAWDQLLGAYLTDYSNLVASEEDWYGRQEEATSMMQSGLQDYQDSISGSTDDYRNMMSQLGGSYRNNIGGIASGMEAKIRGFGGALRGNIGGILDQYGGQMQELQNSNNQAINRFLDVAPQFQRLQNRFGAAARKAEAMSDRAISRGSYWANKLSSEGSASASRLHRMGNESLEDMLSYAARVEEGEAKLQARTEKGDEFSERLLEMSDEMGNRFTAYEDKVLEKSEAYLAANNKWASRAIDLKMQAAEEAQLEIASNIVSQGEAEQAQYQAMRDSVMASDLPDQVKEAQLIELDQQAAASYMRNGAETQQAAVQARFAIDSSVADMMMMAGEQEAAMSGMFLQTQNSLVQMNSFIESQGRTSLAGAALSAMDMGTRATIAGQDLIVQAANIKAAGQQLKMGYATAAENTRMRGLESGAQAELGFVNAANNAMSNSITALQGELQAVYGEASVLEGAAQLTLASNAQMGQWYQHASSLAGQAEFTIHNSNVNAAMRGAEIRAQAEGNIYSSRMQGEGNIYSGMMRSHEVSLNQVNTIAEHHASYRANPVAVADIFLGMMNAEAASYAAGWGSLANNPSLGFNMGNQWDQFNGGGMFG